MRVLMTTDAVGGVWNHSVALAKGLVAAGDEVLLVAVGPQPDEEERARVRAAGIAFARVAGPLEWMETSWGAQHRVEERLLAHARLFRPDLVHLNGFVHAAAPWEVPVVVGAHSTLHGWWSAVHPDRAPPAPWEPYRSQVRAGLAAAQAVVGPTNAVLRELVEHYTADGGVMSSIANGHDAMGGLVGAPTERVFWSGRAWDAGKGLAFLDDVAALGVPWPVEAAGPLRGPAGEAAPAVRHVRLLGRLDETSYRERMAQAAVYVSTARYEPFGLGPLEAATAGCAFLLSDLPSLREVWGSAAVYADPRDPVAFHGALMRLIEDPDLRRAYTVRAAGRARAYTVARMVAAYRALYTRLLEDRGSRRHMPLPVQGGSPSAS